jgi:hypothetical protein
VNDLPEPQPPHGDAPGVVYCGGCNPHIDRTAVATGLTGDPSPAGGATVYLSGCPRACASDHRLSGADVAAAAGAGDAGAGDARPAVVVAGELVDGVPTPAADIVATVKRTLKE